jgi:bifunctional oligoribonuclease and PAP phosphatase NrnA
VDYKAVVRLLKKNTDFIILTHFSADGDAIGSSFALSLSLQKLGKKVCVILEEPVSKIYSFLPANEVYCIQDRPSWTFNENHIAIAIDAGDKSRLGSRLPIFENAAATVNIDHHLTDQGFADINCVDPTYSSSGELIFELIKKLGIKLDKDIAICLYVALITDTGGFKHSNTNSRTHLTAAQLLEYDLDTSYIAMQVFDKTSKPKIMLIRRALGSLCFYLDSRVSVMKVTRNDFLETKADDDDTEGLVELARNIEDVEAAIFIKEIKENKYRVNLRSNTELDISEVAAMFNGGGHKKAAGCSFDGDYDKNLDLMIREISKRI